MREAWGTDTNTLHRLSLWLRRRHPQSTAKLVASEIGADPRAVENWLAAEPSPPCWRHFEAMLKKYGAPFAAEVCAPESDWHRREVLRQRIDALEQIVRELRDSLE